MFKMFKGEGGVMVRPAGRAAEPHSGSLHERREPEDWCYLETQTFPPLPHLQVTSGVYCWTLFSIARVHNLNSLSVVYV